MSGKYVATLYLKNRVIVCKKMIAYDNIPTFGQVLNEIGVINYYGDALECVVSNKFKLPKFFKEICHVEEYNVTRYNKNEYVVISPIIKDDITGKKIDSLTEKPVDIIVSDDVVASKQSILTLINFFDVMKDSLNNTLSTFKAAYDETSNKIDSLKSILDIAAGDTKIALKEIDKVLESNSVKSLQKSLKEEKENNKKLEKAFKKAKAELNIKDCQNNLLIDDSLDAIDLLNEK